MAYCKSCGAGLDEGESTCRYCGTKQSTNNKKSNTSNSHTNIVNDQGGLGWGLVGFCVPILGLVLYLVWKEEQPKNSRALGKGALISVILYVVSMILYFLFIVAMFGGFWLSFN